MSSKKYYYIAVYAVVLFLSSYLTLFSSGNTKLFTLEELTTGSDLIVKGKIVSINCYEKEYGRIYSDISFEVTEVLKGSFNKNQIVLLTYLGGRVNGITTFVLEFPQFSLNEESVLFLSQVDQFNSVLIQYQVMGLSQGKFDVIIKDNIKYIKRDRAQQNNLLIDARKNEIIFSEHSLIKYSDFINTLFSFTK